MKIYPSKLILTFLFIYGKAFASLILSDEFEDNNRNIQNLPSSAAYFYSSPSNTLYEQDGSLVMEGLRDPLFLAYFTPPGEAKKLSVGETLVFAISLRFKRPEIAGDHLYRKRPLTFGLFDSRSTAIEVFRVQADDFSDENPILKDYRGYMAKAPVFPDVVPAIKIDKRTGSYPSFTLRTMEGQTAYEPLNKGSRGYLAEDQIYTAQFFVRRSSEAQVEVSLVVVDDVADSLKETRFFYEVPDSGSPVLRFDTIAFGVDSRNLFEVIRIDSLKVFSL